MAAPTTNRKQSKTQVQRFVAKARELGCDEDEAAFEAKLKKIAKAPPPKAATAKAPARKRRP
jgi:hypothetical protein